MQPENYTDEQKKDIEARVEEARIALGDLKLQPACMPYMQNSGDDVFGIKLVPYLQDTKYSSTPSPIQSDAL